MRCRSREFSRWWEQRETVRPRTNLPIPGRCGWSNPSYSLSTGLPLEVPSYILEHKAKTGPPCTLKYGEERRGARTVWDHRRVPQLGEELAASRCCSHGGASSTSLFIFCLLFSSLPRSPLSVYSRAATTNGLIDFWLAYDVINIFLQSKQLID